MSQPDIQSRTGPGFVASLGIVLNVFIPKGGVYLAGVPITWGYIFLALAAVWGSMKIFFVGEITLGRLLSFLCCLPFLFVAAITMGSNGIEIPSFAISLFVSFGFLPFVLFIALDADLNEEKISRSLKFASAGFFYVAILGIILFVAAIFLKDTIDVPFITTGGGGTVSVADRNNLRGSIFKLTSTFNNGNIYGVCGLMMLPIVNFFESRWKTNLLKLSILLTLSRTAWAGLIFYELGHAILIKRRKGVLKSLLVIAVSAALIVLLVIYAIGFDVTFLFSSDLGGRLSTFQDIGTILPFSVQSYDYIREIVYPSVLAKFGYVGLVSFIGMMIAPLLLRYAQREPFSAQERIIAFSMLIYLMVCWSDGAILYIPVLFFYWALAAALLTSRGIPSLGKSALPSAVS